MQPRGGADWAGVPAKDGSPVAVVYYMNERTRERWDRLGG